MAKPLKTQWEFGDLFAEKPKPNAGEAAESGGVNPVAKDAVPAETPPAKPPAVVAKAVPAAPAKAAAPTLRTVSELTGVIKRLLEREVSQVLVTGEVTNLRAQASGHVYFSIKDPFAQLSCVLFRGEARHVPRHVLEDGKKVVLRGEITVYEARGQYQLRVLAVELQGVGALQAAFEKLKQKLQAEGLFATERKRALPRYPGRVGIVTSPTGAALRDVVHVVRRRDPRLELVVAPCRVQGQGAAEEIAAAIRLLNDWRGGGIDVILVTRGGGSLEDLWAFNEEAVARAVFDSKIPVISGVGHEIDFTICDMVADFRAATPSAAAEIVTEGAFASRKAVAEAIDSMGLSMRRRLEWARADLSQTLARLARSHPRRWLDERLQRLDDLQSGLARSARAQLRRWQTESGGLRQRFARVRPAQLLLRRRETLAALVRGLDERFRRAVESRRLRLAAAGTRLRLLSPGNVLDRGYSITFNSNTGKVIRNATEAGPGDILQTRLKTGTIESVVKAALDTPKPIRSESPSESPETLETGRN